MNHCLEQQQEDQGGREQARGSAETQPLLQEAQLKGRSTAKPRQHVLQRGTFLVQCSRVRNSGKITYSLM